MPSAAICLSCRQGFCSECNECMCCVPAEVSVQFVEPDESLLKSFQPENNPPIIDYSKSKKTGPRKEDEDVRDPKSTGRKRAAQLYPLDLEAPCEWRMLRFAGGGKTPIIGCRNGLQRNRHHGPIKNTLRNEAGNVHRICYECHNRWHAANDVGYDPEAEDFKPHDPDSKASLDDIIDNELHWKQYLPKSKGPNSD